MRVITDSAPAAKSILGSGISWGQMNENGTNYLVNSLFPDVRRLITGDFTEENWEILYISSHAKESQFELLCRLMRADKLHSGSIICCALSGENFIGYRNRSWISIKGNLHLSAFFKPDTIIENFEVGFTIVAAVSLLQTIDDIPGLTGQSSIKWVNDVQINGAKVGGIITHTQVTGMQINGVVIGLGLNVERTPRVKRDIFVPEVTSLSQFLPCKKREIFRSLIKQLYKNYDLLINGEYLKLLDIYRSRSSIIGRHAHLYTDPFKGEPKLIADGIVSHIGNNLELYFDNRSEPFYKGRLVLNP